MQNTILRNEDNPYNDPAILYADSTVDLCINNGYGFIYTITNTVNGKKYVGKAGAEGSLRSYRERWREHRKALRGGYHCNDYLQRAWDKYGGQAFTFDVIDINEVSTLGDCEILHIERLNTFNNGFNLTKGGDGGSPSEETRAKISKSLLKAYENPLLREKVSKALKGREVTEEHRSKISNTLKGTKLTEDRKAKITKGLKQKWQDLEYRSKQVERLTGREVSEETRTKISLAQAGDKGNNAILTNEQARIVYLDYTTPQKELAKRYGVGIGTISLIQLGETFTEVTKGLTIHPRHNAKLEGKEWEGNDTAPKKVAQFTLEGRLVKVYESISAVKANGYHSGNVCQCCKNNYAKKGNVYKGYKWAYYNEDN